ncbi:hypothetical protein CPB86DRAFT_851609 [Serendipita vermifera]|nr:hypothetical protein CPB86DRAFT_851609 [Serendipita vermifera]
MSEDGLAFLNSTSGEIAFFRGLCDARPVGIHREFNMMAVAAYIKSATGRRVSVDDLWTKFKTCYNIERLESYERPGYFSHESDSSLSSSEDGMDVEDQETESVAPTSPVKTRSSHKPLKGKDHSRTEEDQEQYPFFRREFELPVGPGWPPLAATMGTVMITGKRRGSGSVAGGQPGHGRKESVATSRTTRGQTQAATSSSASKPGPGKTAMEESDSDLTSEGAEDGNEDEEEGGDGDEKEGDESDDGGKERDEKDVTETAQTRSVADGDEHAAGTRRSTRHTRTATKDTVSLTKGTTKKKRG